MPGEFVEFEFVELEFVGRITNWKLLRDIDSVS